MLIQSFRLGISSAVLFLSLSSIAQANAVVNQTIVCSEGSTAVLTVKKVSGQPTVVLEGVHGKAHQPRVVISRDALYEHTEFTRHYKIEQQCAEVVPTSHILDQIGYYLDGCLDSEKTEMKMTLDLNLADPRDSHLRVTFKTKTLDFITQGLFRSYDKPYIVDSAVQCSVETF